MSKTLASLCTLLIAGGGTAAAPSLPAGISSQVPPGYAVLGHASVTAGKPIRHFEIVALGRRDEDARSKAGDAPVRPLMVFETHGPRFARVGRNDDVVLRADEGGQCDPFLDGDATIATKGRYFTVQNGVACGEHWTDYVTFRLDDRAGGFVFDNERTESWKLNPSSDPNAEALIPDGAPHVIREHPGHVTPFAVWRRSR